MTDLKALNKRYKQAVNKIAADLAIPYGWLDGGCLVLSDALVLWGQGILKPGGVLRCPTGKSPYLDHAFAYHEDFEEGSCVLVDGDGFQTPHRMLNKIRTLTHDANEALYFSPCHALAKGVPANLKQSRLIAKTLEQLLGSLEDFLTLKTSCPTSRKCRTT